MPFEILSHNKLFHKNDVQGSALNIAMIPQAFPIRDKHVVGKMAPSNTGKETLVPIVQESG
jgi:hypothetical protein